GSRPSRPNSSRSSRVNAVPLLSSGSRISMNPGNPVARYGSPFASTRLSNCFISQRLLVAAVARRQRQYRAAARGVGRFVAVGVVAARRAGRALVARRRSGRVVALGAVPRRRVGRLGALAVGRRRRVGRGVGGRRRRLGRLAPIIGRGGLPGEAHGLLGEERGLADRGRELGGALVGDGGVGVAPLLEGDAAEVTPRLGEARLGRDGLLEQPPRALGVAGVV